MNQDLMRAYSTTNNNFGFLTKLHYLDKKDISKKSRHLASQYPQDLDAESLELEYLLQQV